MNWDQYFLKIATTVALKSKDPNTRVGCVIINKDKRIIGTGYNGFPPGYPETPENWASPNKYHHVIHAEDNALRNLTQSADGCSLYVTLFPCPKCADLIQRSGIKRVFYPESVDDKYFSQNTVDWLTSLGITCTPVGE